MIIALDVGNSQIFGGVFRDGELIFRFRKTSGLHLSSDEFGIFLRQVLCENDLNPEQVQRIVIGSVVPELNHSINSACIKYFDIRPLNLQAGLKTGLKLKIASPNELGADRIAGAVAAMRRYPNKNLVIIDFGTAITVCVITAEKEYLGGLIVPGLRLSMMALEQNTARLPTVEIQVPESLIGRTTVENIQSGLYYSALGMAKEVVHRLHQDARLKDGFMIIGTGGFSGLFTDEALFDAHDPDLVLKGLYQVHLLNPA